MPRARRGRRSARSSNASRREFRRAGGRAERLHLVEDPRQQRRLVEQRLGLLVEVALVRRAAALGHEEELVGVAVDRRDLDLRRQVRAGVLLGVHVERRHLGVPQVRGLVRVVDPVGDRRLVAAPGEHELAFLALHDRGAGVLAHRQDTPGGDRCVLQQVESDEPVVVGGFGVVEDVAQLLEMARAQEVRDVVHCLGGEAADRFGLDFQKGAVRCVEGRHSLCADEPVVGVVGAQREQLGVGERGNLGHTPRLRPSRNA